MPVYEWNFPRLQAILDANILRSVSAPVKLLHKPSTWQSRILYRREHLPPSYRNETLIISYSVPEVKDIVRLSNKSGTNERLMTVIFAGSFSTQCFSLSVID